MACVEEEFAEVKWPDTEELVLGACDTETGACGDVADGGVVNTVNSIEFLGMVINLIKKARFRSYINCNRLSHLLLDRLHILTRLFKCKYCEMSISCEFIKHDSIARKMSVFNSPESDIFFST